MREDARVRVQSTLVSSALFYALIAYCAQPCAADTLVGVQAIAISGQHLDPSGDLNGSGAGAFFQIVQRWKGLRIHLEGVPVLATSHADSPRYGVLTQSFGLFNGVVSVPIDRSRHIWAGLGSGILAQRTPYVNAPYRGWDSINASRLAGTRYELQGRWNAGTGFWDATFAGLPRMHGNDFITTHSPFGVRQRSEGETAGMTDIMVDYGLRHGPFEYALGVRWINFSANYDNGVPADRNIGAGPTLTVLWSI